MRARWVNVALGVWLFISAWLFVGEGSELANNLFLGLSIFLVAFLAMGVAGFRRLNTILGLWAIVSPFLLDYGDAGAALNDLVVGILVVSASLWVPRDRRLRLEYPVA